MDKQIVISSSSISLFLECPRCFWLHRVKGIKRPPMIFPSLPSGMDRVLKEHFDGHRSKGRKPKELHGKFTGHLYADVAKLNEWRNNRKGLRYTDKDSGIVLMGALDDLFVAPDGLYAPLDFKTRGFPLKPDTHTYYQNQMDIYSFLLKANGMPPAGFAILIFYHPKKVDENCNVDFQPDCVKIKTSVAAGKRLFTDAMKCLLQKKEPKASTDCPFCGWNH
ncbi:MAG: PD-(D/E)XK nuclease family protein [Candidatus Aenigmatarchaeota archaeon]